MLFTLTGILSFSGCGRTDPEITVVAITPGPEETAEAASLSGGWYGYWEVSDPEGYWEEVDGRSWDCCGETLAEENGICLLLWDADLPRSNCLARLWIREENGMFSCAGGEFLDVAVTPGEVSLRLSVSQGTVLQVAGWFDDSLTGSFCYTVCLRPWGDPWPDAVRRPPHYESWYLPKIKTAGSVPDSIDLPDTDTP